MSNRVVLSLGGNEGDVMKTLKRTIGSLESKVGVVVLTSSVYRTEAWGIENQPDFLNQVVVLQTTLTPYETLRQCLEIEQVHGRERVGKKKWHQRAIDVDILFYDDQIIQTTDLTVPHPHLHERNFVLFPLEELVPDYLHPVLLKTVFELKNSCSDKLLATKVLD